MDVDAPVCVDAPGSGCYRDILSTEGASHQGSHGRLSRRCLGHKDSRPSSASSTCSKERDIPETLANLLMDMLPEEGPELGDAFLCAADLPPVTKQSLGELDIQSIINNIKLRHDVNFDANLSFRPNMDGPKGQQKQRQSQQYWRALVAELELYVRLFRGTPSLWDSGRVDRSVIVQHAERRLPKLFETIHEVLKSLVPDRDHARVDEHLDVPMLMQEIERGVCDMVKLAEWVACLLKEHCAPMRDVLVNKMVDRVREGVAKNTSGLIVNGLAELFGILEAMKLDVANHQIRNLKTLLIEDTVNFENFYHLDRLVSGRARVDRNAAQKWWTCAVTEFQHHCTSPPHRFKLEIFIRAVVASLFTRSARRELPDTFYLDKDRLRTLKSEIDDLIHFEICFDLFAQLLQEFEYNGPVSQATRHQLQSALSAIVGEGVPYLNPSWFHHSGPLSLEIYRQASVLAGRSPFHNLDYLQKARYYLRNLFETTFATHASALEATILPQILACATKHFYSSPSELFNSLVLPTPTPPPPPHSFVPIRIASPDTLSPSHADKLNDLTNRITHIVLLHWRIWDPIAYVKDDETPTNSPPVPQHGQNTPVQHQTRALGFPKQAHRPIPIHTSKSS
ncbi:hypothetical protein K458DRAFT_285704 [Lentithecium fluviatile CBS 122367]|uniref:Tcp11-domain-containing protein n=1 Tax=Lentithecium fluviatile CBS 122367 TaxID=1168545 RepID=A0A6G1JPK8_9PLEO|nr:hypothetical protein K458DRAFT_285704 [Lentithecium fluviatile CBS 122367]